MRRFVASLLLLPALSLPLSALADEDDEHVIGPSTVDEQVKTNVSEPVDVSNIVISTQTDADRFVNATTPLALALGIGSLSLVIYTLARSSNGTEKD
jgi:hypothetical protein